MKRKIDWEAKAKKAKAKREASPRSPTQEYTRSSIEKLLKKRLEQAGAKKVRARVFLSLEELLADERAYRFVHHADEKIDKTVKGIGLKGTFPVPRDLNLIDKKDPRAKLYLKLLFPKDAIRTWWSYDAKDLFVFLGPRADLKRLSGILKKEAELAGKIWKNKKRA